MEIRHIETGYLAQVIQGSNLRLLFADTLPTSAPVPSKGMMQLQQQQALVMGIQQQPSFNGGGPYGQMPYPSQQQHRHHHHHQQQHHHPHLSQQGFGGVSRMPPQAQILPQLSPPSMLFGGRDEILVVSDDRVFALKPAGGGGGGGSGSGGGSTVSGSQSSHTVVVPDGGSMHSSGGSSWTMVSR